MRSRGALTDLAKSANRSARSTGLEITCAGCGLILLTVSVHEARTRAATTEALGRQALRKHVTTTGCSGDPVGNEPRKRDGRCGQRDAQRPHLHLPPAGSHIPGCRCDLEPRAEDVFAVMPTQ